MQPYFCIAVKALICSIFHFCSHICSLFMEQSLIYLQIYTYIIMLKWWRGLLLYLLLTRWTRKISTMSSVYQDENTSAELNLCRQQRLAERRRDSVSHPQHLSWGKFLLDLYISSLAFLCLIPRVKWDHTGYRRDKTTPFGPYRRHS